MYYGMYNCSPDSIDDLQEFFYIPVESIQCPVNGEYIISCFEENCYIACPSNVIMSHGNILNGECSWPYDPSNYLEECRGNMMALATGCAMYYGMYNCYPDSIEDLQQFFPYPVDYICCPVNGDYIFSGGEEDCYIACPSDVIPSHGYILNGETSWPCDPHNYFDECRSNMMSLASGLSVYFGIYNRFPEVLSDLEDVMENWDVECPACASIYMYETNPEGDTYTITCPISPDHNHGSIEDGMISW